MKKLTYTLGITLLCIVVNAQTPYYYPWGKTVS